MHLLYYTVYSTENFVHITPLGAELSMSVVRERLAAAGRTLTTGQLSVVEKALSNCSLPLYVRLVSEEVCRWSSYQQESETVLQQTVDDIINTLFDRLELYHGKVRLRHVSAVYSSFTFKSLFGSFCLQPDEVVEGLEVCFCNNKAYTSAV